MRGGGAGLSHRSACALSAHNIKNISCTAYVYPARRHADRSHGIEDTLEARPRASGISQVYLGYTWRRHRAISSWPPMAAGSGRHGMWTARAAGWCRVVTAAGADPACERRETASALGAFSANSRRILGEFSANSRRILGSFGLIGHPRHPAHRLHTLLPRNFVSKSDTGSDSRSDSRSQATRASVTRVRARLLRRLALLLLRRLAEVLERRLRTRVA